VAGGWRRLHNDKFHNVYTSPNIIRVIDSRTVRWAGHVASMGAMRNAYNIMDGKPEEKRPLGRPTRGQEKNTGMDLRIRWEGVDWIHLVQDRDQWWAVVNTVMNLRVPQKAGNSMSI
jgi:hypothetical protein